MTTPRTVEICTQCTTGVHQVHSDKSTHKRNHNKMDLNPASKRLFANNDFIGLHCRSSVVDGQIEASGSASLCRIQFCIDRSYISRPIVDVFKFVPDDAFTVNTTSDWRIMGWEPGITGLVSFLGFFSQDFMFQWYFQQLPIVGYSCQYQLYKVHILLSIRCSGVGCQMLTVDCQVSLSVVVL